MKEMNCIVKCDGIEHASQIIEFMAVTSMKEQHNVKGANKIKMRVIEIYYGFMDYIHGVTTGKAQHHSLSGRNAYAICRPHNSHLTMKPSPV
jgi:hypothetical protein